VLLLWGRACMIAGFAVHDAESPFRLSGHTPTGTIVRTADFIFPGQQWACVGMMVRGEVFLKRMGVAAGVYNGVWSWPDSRVARKRIEESPGSSGQGAR
jgi:hypothetical protein